MAEKKNVEEQQPREADAIERTEIEPLSDESIEEVTGGVCSNSFCTFAQQE